MKELIYSSAVLCLSQTTEFMRNKSLDNTLLHLIVQNGIQEFTVQSAYESIHLHLPIRIEEVEKSLRRSFSNGIIKTISGEFGDNLKKTKFALQEEIIERIDAHCEQLTTYLDDAINELFEGIVNKDNKSVITELLLEVVTKLMAKYGYAYAGQLAGIAEATDFVPNKVLTEICTESLQKYQVDITTSDLSECISILFDRRDPRLNGLAFSVCNRYYLSRLIGLDLPIDFLTSNIYKDSQIFLDTNFIIRIAFSKGNRHNEFREILKKSSELGIRFVVSELTVAEFHSRVDEYKEDFEKAEEVIPEELINEIREGIVEENQQSYSDDRFDVGSSNSAKRLLDMGVEIIPHEDGTELYSKEEMEEKMTELHDFDRKYRTIYPAKNNNALFHDAYLYFLVRNIRKTQGANKAWFMTMDNSVIEHGISNKEVDSGPYSIRLLSLLQTLSQFVESQALKSEFADMFGELISKDLLPSEQLFSFADLKLLIGFDIKAKDIPPEFVRKATLHIKKNVLKGGGLTDGNKAEIIYEFNKFLATPEQNFIELQKKYDKKISARDEDIKIKEQRINDLETSVENQKTDYDKLIKQKDDQNSLLQDQISNLKTRINSFLFITSGLILSYILWYNKSTIYLDFVNSLRRPTLFNLAIQLIILSTVLLLIFPNRKKLIIIIGAIGTLGSLIGGLAL